MLCDSENIASRFTVVKTGKVKELFSKKTGKKID